MADWEYGGFYGYMGYDLKPDRYNGVYDRYDHPVLTREHIPLTWRCDLDAESNPYFTERLGDVSNVVFTNVAIARLTDCVPYAGESPEKRGLRKTAL